MRSCDEPQYHRKISVYNSLFAPTWEVSNGQERTHQTIAGLLVSQCHGLEVDVERVCESASSLGCPALELVPFELWPVVRRHGLQNALAYNGMPDPVFAKGLNNPRYRDEVMPRTNQFHPSMRGPRM